MMQLLISLFCKEYRFQFMTYKTLIIILNFYLGFDTHDHPIFSATGIHHSMFPTEMPMINATSSLPFLYKACRARKEEKMFCFVCNR